jgi:hypothetical protein
MNIECAVAEWDSLNYSFVSGKVGLCGLEIWIRDNGVCMEEKVRGIGGLLIPFA